MKKTMCMVAAVAWIAACGKSQQPEPITIDFGEPDVTVSDSGGGDGSTGDMGAANNEIPPETERPDIEIPIMDREVTFADGEAPLLAFDVPDDAVSVVVSVTGQKGNQYTLASWTNGDGSDIVESGWLDSDQGAPSLCLSCTNRVAASESAFAAIAPNNEGVTLQPGQHTIVAYGFTAAGFAVRPLSSGTATVRVVIKRLPAAPDTGVLDINFYLTGARGWTAETAPTDSEFQDMVALVDELYEQVGVDVGTITYTDIGEEYAVIESVLFGPDLQELFELSANQPRHAINVFLVEELFLGAGPGFGVLLGVSGGIPGPPVAGTPRSGVVVNTKGDPNLPIPTASVLAHEIGHHLGLFHTTESMGGVNDPIGDTPPNDSTQLMFHASVDGTTLTTTQGMVMRGNPWVNHQEAP